MLQDEVGAVLYSCNSAINTFVIKMSDSEEKGRQGTIVDEGTHQPKPKQRQLPSASTPAGTEEARDGLFHPEEGTPLAAALAGMDTCYS